MKKVTGVLLLGLFVSICVLVLKAAPPQDEEQKQMGGSAMNVGVPWAYSYATPIPPPAAGRGGAGGGGGAAGRGGAGGGNGGGGGRGGAGGGGAAAPAAPAAPPEDRDAIHHLEGTDLAFAIKDIDNNYGPADWYPGDHPPMPEIVSHGRKPVVNACGFCHYPSGQGRPNNGGPAGLPADYILQELADFKDGSRDTADKRKRNETQMIDIAKGLTPEEAKEAADYFAAAKWRPYIKVVEAAMVPKMYYVNGGGGLCLPVEGGGMEPIGDRLLETPQNPELTEPLRDPRSGFIAYVPPGTLKRGEALVVGGGPGKTVACAACHGEGLHGNGYFPPLAGRSPSYLARQLNDFKHFTRVGPGSQLMQPIVAHLSDDDVLAIVAYIGSLKP